jgi:hypothetical protein
MNVFVDRLYQDCLIESEHERLSNAVLECCDAANDLYGNNSDLLHLMWTLGVDRDGDKVDCLSLQFNLDDRSPSSVNFPIINTRRITGATLLVKYMRALEYTKPDEKKAELQS